MTKGPHKEHDLEDVEAALEPLVAKVKEKKMASLQELERRHGDMKEGSDKEAEKLKEQITSSVQAFKEILDRYAFHLVKLFNPFSAKYSLRLAGLIAHTC